MFPALESRRAPWDSGSTTPIRAVPLSLAAGRLVGFEELELELGLRS